MVSTIESVTGVSVQCNWLYPNAQTLEFFPTGKKSLKKNRVAIVYGRNSSGKSTIAQGFREYIDPTLPRTIELTPLINATPIHTPPGVSPEKFMVFDEKYVEQRVRVKEQGLDAIVLFGKQVAIDEQMEQVTNSIESLKIQRQQQETECAQYTDISAVTAPKYWMNKIIRGLQADGGWAEKKGIDINGSKQKAKVNEQEVDRIRDVHPRQSEQETKAEFDCQYALYQRANTQAQEITGEIREHKIAKNPEEISMELFAKVIAKPQTTAREKELLELFNIRVISEAKAFLSDTTKKKCPTCLQDIGEEYRDDTLSCIEGILNREVEAFQSILKGLLQESIDKGDYGLYSELDAEAYANVHNCIDAFNQAVDKHNSAVQAKIDNPFQAMMYDVSIGLTDACVALNQALAILEEERVVFNNAISEPKKLRTPLLELNDEIAYYALKDDYSQLVAQRKAKNEADAKLISLSGQISEFERKKLSLDAQRKDYQIAVEDINDSLAYIFFSRGRLELVFNENDQMYHLKSNGKEVDPKKVSCGERNALALSYYFTEIAKETDVREIYTDEAFLVIDDPVSSFDMENRVGILSFLRWKLGKVLLGCPTTKVLVMTHDISILYDMQKAFDEITAECKGAGKFAECRPFELLGRDGIKKFDVRTRHEYTCLLKTVYDFALNGSSETELFVGNTMRRVLEAFSTFLYRKGITDVSYDPAILSEIGEDKRTYFQNLMYRLVLHGESHYAEHIKGLQGMDFFSHLSQVEKQRTAQDILCFMYSLNKPHLLAHLEQNAEHDLKGWIARISQASPIKEEPPTMETC